jgi:predicted O-methyltransferase YrrM
LFAFSFLFLFLHGPGAILVAANAISRQALDRAQSDPRVDAVLVPIGTGDLVCRKK